MNCRDDVARLLNASPRLALALAEEAQFVPYIFVVTDGWTTSGTPDPLLDVQSDPTNIQQDLRILSVDVDIQTPDFNTGSVLKPQADLAYVSTSGITCDVRIEGFAARATPYFPLKNLPTFGTVGSGAQGASGSFRRPWVLLADQNLVMDFAVTTALPSDSTTITCTYTCETTIPFYFKMDQGKALDRLEALGYCVASARAHFCVC